MTKAILNNNGISTKSGDITVYNYDCETREYLSSTVEYLPVGVGIPANSCTDAPGESKDGFAICRTADLTSWIYIIDKRGQTVYSTETMQQVQVTTLGDYPTHTTPIAPTSLYDKWNGEQWVTDVEAQHAANVATAEGEKLSRTDQANDYMNKKQWPGKAALGRLTETEKEQYNLWLDYLDALESVDISSAPDINWPESPEE
ncbi:tail fiber assembly protein [Escherichia coli]|nr:MULTISPECIES: tail fiber assembly protein [Enterobacteriaceae]EFB4131282.1 tail fiber assembly protein [Escherichia coli O100]AUX62682.1 tail fiber assembly protein [Escherichia coli]EEV9896865.1 tail fiber assembly protein [Escherichia coli]EFA7466274.1 tail fiber assembly protein [Escherichia coli]EFB2451086.1 tail fiber assembly protein [Escherichia coli]